MAMLVVAAGVTALHDRAVKFRVDSRGAWCDMAAPENFSFSFVRFVLSTAARVPELLTPAEAVFFRDLASDGALWINRNNTLLAMLPYGARKTSIRVRKVRV